MRRAALFLLALAPACGGSEYRPRDLSDRAAPVAVTDPSSGATEPGDMPPPLSRRRAPMPPPLEMRLSNGVRLLLVPRHELPLVSVSFVLRHDPSESLTVVPNLYAAAMREEGVTSSGHAQRYLRSAAVRWTSWSTGDAWTLDATMLAPYFAEVMPRLGAMVSGPAFADEDVSRAQSKLVMRSVDDRQYRDQTVRGLAERMLLGETHPHAWRRFEIAAIRKSSRADLLRFENAYLAAEDLTVVVVGDFRPEDARNSLEASVGKLRAKRPAARAWWQEQTPTSTKARIVLVPWQKATQSKIALALPGVSWTSPERPAMAVLRELLVSSWGRLAQRLREEKGMSYGVSGAISSWKTGGVFTLSTAVEAPQTVEAVSVIVRELERTGTSPISERELERAREHATTGARLGGGSPHERERYVLEAIAMNDLPLDYMERFAAGVEAVTVEDVRAVATKYLRADALHIAVAGEPSLEAPLRALGIAEVSRRAP